MTRGLGITGVVEGVYDASLGTESGFRQSDFHGHPRVGRLGGLPYLFSDFPDLGEFLTIQLALQGLVELAVVEARADAVRRSGGVDGLDLVDGEGNTDWLSLASLPGILTDLEGEGHVLEEDGVDVHFGGVALKEGYG